MSENAQHYWFRTKKYGWGWGVPQTWQGWTVLLAYGMLVSGLALMTLGDNKPTPADIFVFVGGTLLATLILIAICFTKGETPRWRWG